LMVLGSPAQLNDSRGPGNSGRRVRRESSTGELDVYMCFLGSTL
jgi:hypothetical protein